MDAVRSSIVENARLFSKHGRCTYRIERKIESSSRSENSSATVDIRWIEGQSRTTLNYIENTVLHQKLPQGVSNRRDGVKHRVDFLATPKRWVVWSPYDVGGRGRLFVCRPGSVLEVAFADLLHGSPAYFFRRGVPGQGPPLDALIGPNPNHPSKSGQSTWEIRKQSKEPSLVTVCLCKGNQGGDATVETFIDMTLGLPTRRTAKETVVPIDDRIEWKWIRNEEFGGYAIAEATYSLSMAGEVQKWTLLDLGADPAVPSEYFEESNLKVLRLTEVEDRIANRRFPLGAEKPISEQSLRGVVKPTKQRN